MGPEWVWVMMSVLVLGAGFSDGCLEQERLALLQLKPFFNDLQYLPTWTEEVGSDCCRWELVECNITTKRVTELSLNWKTSSGWIMDSTPLDISFLESIGILTSLKTLSLYDCSLAGTLPTQGWCYLKSLEELRLNGNALGGAIASCLGNLTFLRFLDISDNHFTGNVASTSLTNLTMLKFLSLSNNQFQVPVSFNSFADHSNLKILFSDGNKLVAEPTVFQTWPLKLQLKVFSLSNCTIEHRKLQLPNFLHYQYDLRYIDLSYNNFGGIRFPDWLVENNTRLETLFMTDSSIVGPFFLPLDPHDYVRTIDISNNKMHHIPTNFCSVFPN
ncbi:polygalacturonase inhibitor-like [Durio zibethinus]|uniref:Polygalacturonase inhibitor-like n=1 Tax=Durio zibethinus TaxID=66656 RepID=A0A6P5X1S0_DURZI|nr:polygalacturonase inhibitor-like [Durio zibethinus]